MPTLKKFNGGTLQEASAASAVFQFFVRDITGMLGGIIFAASQGSSFDSNAKQWRLFADCLNNVGAAHPQSGELLEISGK